MGSILRWSGAVAGCLLAACGSTATLPPVMPPPPATAPVPHPVTPEAPTTPPPDYGAIPPAPPSCDAFVAHRGPTSCTAKHDGQVALAGSIATRDVLERDAELAQLLPCTTFPPGTIAALRAELAPPECGDAILEDVVTRTDSSPDPSLRDALTGLALAAQLDRLVGKPPELEGPCDKQRFGTFLREVLAGWISGQAKAIQLLAEGGATLSGYGKGIVAVHAGLADMRFVAVVRAVPIPKEFSADDELKDAYYGVLDQALEQRKARGRDGALLGLRLLSEAGIHDDVRVMRARKLLSELYAASRIDALDHLLLPRSVPNGLKSPALTLASRLPTFYVPRLLPKIEPSETALLAAILEHGLPPILRAMLDEKTLPPKTRLLFGKALMQSGRLFWRAADFEQAAKVLAPLAQGGPDAADARLLVAVADALRNGSRDAVDMMLRGPFPSGAPNVTRLDALARGAGEPAAHAAFDAALILGLAPPEKGAKTFFLDLERRYRAAGERTESSIVKTEATERAAAAAATAAAIVE